MTPTPNAPKGLDWVSLSHTQTIKSSSNERLVASTHKHPKAINAGWFATTTMTATGHHWERVQTMCSDNGPNGKPTAWASPSLYYEWENASQAVRKEKIMAIIFRIYAIIYRDS